jgi:hypothetical protein
MWVGRGAACDTLGWVIECDGERFGEVPRRLGFALGQEAAAAEEAKRQQRTGIRRMVGRRSGAECAGGGKCEKAGEGNARKQGQGRRKTR